MDTKDLANKGLEKVPEFKEFRKDQKAGAFYIFLIIFFCYFIYNEVYKGSDCDKRLQVLEKTIVVYEQQRIEDKARIANLEKALDIQLGVVRVVSNKVDSIKTVN